jgi:hypothetical protein
MPYKFRIGDQIEPTAEALKRFRNWRGRQGMIVGLAPDAIWQVRWVGRPKAEFVHEDFIARQTVPPRGEGAR